MCSDIAVQGSKQTQQKLSFVPQLFIHKEEKSRDIIDRSVMI